jgi:hypothetical protein
MKAEKMIDRERLAYHEAGHAVVAHILGMRITGVSIKRTEDGPGRTLYDLPDEEVADPGHLLRCAQICQAGIAAESMKYGDRIEGLWGKGREYDWVDDMVFIEKHIDQTPKKRESARELRNSLRKKTVNSLCQHWLAVEALVSALLKYEDVTGDEARQVIEEVIGQ